MGGSSQSGGEVFGIDAASSAGDFESGPDDSDLVNMMNIPAILIHQEQVDKRLLRKAMI